MVRVFSLLYIEIHTKIIHMNLCIVFIKNEHSNDKGTCKIIHFKKHQKYLGNSCNQAIETLVS